MNTPTRLGLYGLGLAMVFAGSLGAGRLVDPRERTPAHRTDADHATAAPADTDGGAPVAAPGGLQVNEAGYRLVPLTSGLAVGDPRDFRFRILGTDGRAVTRYTPTHEKELHLIVVRRDLAGFRHVHPTRADDGTWSIALGVAEAGQYRVFADFRPAGRDAALTLGVDVPAAGTFRPRPLPAPARSAQVDGYRVDLAGDLVPGTASRLTLRISRGGKPVSDLRPYLGAYGHLVALRDGDLAYLHVHPDGSPDDGRTAAGPDITFHVEVPSAGVYRLYLDFRHGGAVRTAEFTAVAGEGVALPPTASTTSGPETTPGPDRAPTGATPGPDPDGHDDQPHG